MLPIKNVKCARWITNSAIHRSVVLLFLWLHILTASDLQRRAAARDVRAGWARGREQARRRRRRSLAGVVFVVPARLADGGSATTCLNSEDAFLISSAKASATTQRWNKANRMREMHQLYRVFAHVASRSAGIARMGCHVTHTMGRAPLVLIGHAVSIIGEAIPIIAINYGILVACWMLHMFDVVQSELISRAMPLRSSWRSTSQFLDTVGSLVYDLYNSSAIDRPSCGDGEQFVVNGMNSGESRARSIVNDGDLRDLQHPPTPDFLDSDRIYAVLVLECVCSSGGAPSMVMKMEEAHAKQMHDVTWKKRPSRRDNLGRSFWRIMARNEWCVTFAVVVATLQLFLRLTRANVTTLFLPMLSQATGCRSKAELAGHAVLVLVSAGGILGSALAARLYGREVMCVIGGVLIVFCQVVIPAAMDTHAGMHGGGSAYAAAATFFLACAASGGCGWSWGSLFWAVPGEGVRSAGDAVGAALGFLLGFAQMHCFLLMLRQLKHAALAYYAVWIWS